MKKLLITVSVCLMATMTVAAQEPVTVTVGDNDYKYAGTLRANSVGELFIQELASITFRNRDVYKFNLDEKSAQTTGKQTIEIAFVNDATFYCLSKGAILEIFPYKDIYYCKDCNPQHESGQISKWSFRNTERKITRFLEGTTDTLTLDSNRIDSRYTPLLIKNLSNDSEIYFEGRIHNSGYKIKKRFFGLIKKKEYAEWDEIYYEPARMCDWAIWRLFQIFIGRDWGFYCPSTNASAKEWQKWYDKLLKPVAVDSEQDTDNEIPSYEYRSSH